MKNLKEERKDWFVKVRAENSDKVKHWQVNIGWIGDG